MKGIFIVLLISFFVFTAWFRQICIACTTFQLNHNGHSLVDKNTDWMVGDGSIFINKRDVKKTAVAIDLFDRPDPGPPESWTSTYTQQTNRALIKNAFGKIPSPVIVGWKAKAIIGFIKSGFQRFPGIPEINLEAFITYPDTTVCKNR